MSPRGADQAVYCRIQAMTTQPARYILGTLAVPLLLMTPRFAGAQTAAASTASPPPPHEGSAEFAFVGTTGNSSTESIGLGGELIDRPGPWELSAKVAYVRNESESELKAESISLTTKAARALTMRLATFGRYVYLHDRFAGIEGRNGVEGGLAYVLVDAAPHKLTVDGGVGYAHGGRVSAAALPSATLPGLGQFYHGEFWRGICWLIVTPGLWIGSGGLFGWVCHVIAAISAYKRAQRKNAIAAAGP